MHRYKCYIVDDEPLALNVIEQHLSRFTRIEVCGKTTNPIEALAQIRFLQPDLLFIDIEMPEINGLELITSIRNKPEVIITTAYREYAVEGFEENVLDYLVKPVSFKRFVSAMDKFFDKKAASGIVSSTHTTGVLLVRSDRKNVRVDLSSILYIEGLKDYVRIVTLTEKILTKVSIGHIVKDLPPEQFIQVHKSFVVAKDKISAFTAQDVEIGDIEIPIGRIYKEEVIRRLG